MKALWLENQEVSLKELRSPVPLPGEALLRTRLAGICNTDIELLKGYMNFTGVPGHEFVADVVECEDEALVGKRVIGDINAACGHCRLCSLSMPAHCPARTVLGIFNRQGCFADYFTLPVKNLVPIENNIRDFDAVFAEPLAAALQVTRQVQLPDRVLVVGDGKLGLLTATVLRLSGVRVWLRGHHKKRLEIVRKLGVLGDPGGDFPLVVECSGDPHGFTHSMRRVEPRGTLVLKTTCQQSPPTDLTPLVVNEITVVGSRCGPIEEALKWIPRRDVYETLSNIRGHVLPLERGVEALRLAQEPGVLKVLLDNNP
jgi:threonine dehydrogenase-like Zn-dependent dehydrogenase